MDPNAKNIFALLCLLGIIAIAVVAMLEIRRMRRGESLITPVQFRLRMMSALIWVILLGSISYAVLNLWPAPGDLPQAKRFASVIGGVFLLLFIALFLTIYDLWLFSLQRRLKQAEFNRELAALAHAEIQRVQETRGTESDFSVPPPDSASKNGMPQ